MKHWAGFLIAWIFLSLPLAEEKADIIVAKDGSGDFSSIQQALNSIPSNNSKNLTILIKNGTYQEHIGIDRSYVSLIGEDRENTIIEFSIEREAWNTSHGSTIGCAVINIGATASFQKASGTITDVVIGNLTVRNTFDNTGVKTMAIKDEGNSNRITIVHSNVWSKGHDTVSLWSKASGMYYHANSDFTGSVDFVAPRGWCYAVACNFYETTGSAPLWHEVAANTSQKFTVRTGNFAPASGNSSNFKLLNQNNSSALGTRFYVLDSRIDPKCTTRGTVNEAYFYNCHGPTSDQGWYADNLSSSAAGDQREVTARWTFDNQWDPENTLPRVLPMSSLPQPWSGAYGLDGESLELKWIMGRNAETNVIRFGDSENPPVVATQPETSYLPSGLQKGTYYWRVDAVSGADTVAGEEWSFTVEKSAPPVALLLTSQPMTSPRGFLTLAKGKGQLLFSPGSKISARFFDLRGKEIGKSPEFMDLR